MVGRPIKQMPNGDLRSMFFLPSQTIPHLKTVIDKDKQFEVNEKQKYDFLEQV